MADDFFDQLAGGALRDPRPADPPAADPDHGEEPPAQDRPSAAADPRAEHPLGRAPVRRPRTRFAPRPDGAPGREARRRGSADPKPVSRCRSALRVAAVVAIGLAAVAILNALLGGAGDRTSNGTPAPVHTRLRLSWREAPHAGRTLTARWRRGGDATLAGRLTTPGGESVQGADISVLGSDPARAQLGSRAIGEVRTDAHGRFHATVALDRGSARKRLTFVYLPHAEDPSPAARASATLAVRAPITASASPIRLSGRGRVRLRGATVPTAKVTLLSRTPAEKRWRLLTTLRAPRNGDWQRSLALPAPGSYSLIARVGPDSSRGYAGAHSAPLTVRVR